MVGLGSNKTPINIILGNIYLLYYTLNEKEQKNELYIIYTQLRIGNIQLYVKRTLYLIDAVYIVRNCIR